MPVFILGYLGVAEKSDVSCIDGLLKERSRFSAGRRFVSVCEENVTML